MQFRDNIRINLLISKAYCNAYGAFVAGLIFCNHATAVQSTSVYYIVAFHKSSIKMYELAS